MGEEVTYRAVGTVRTPFESPADVPKRESESVDAAGRVEICEEYAEGLALLDGFSHVALVSHLDRVSDATLRCDPAFAPGVRPGIFATRGPRRPNPIGYSIVRLRGVDGTTLRVEGIDLVDGTPVLDVRPYAPKRAGVEFEEFRAGWLEEHTDQSFDHMRADE